MNENHATLALLAGALALGAAAADLVPSANVAEVAAQIDKEEDHLSALELGERIMHGDSRLRVIDLRPNSEFEVFHVPGAQRSSMRDLSTAALPKNSTVVLYSEGGTHAAQAWVLLRIRGYRDVFVLREGMYEWASRVMEPRLATDATASERMEFERAAKLSLYFGGTPRSDVPRSEIPAGYWTGSLTSARPDLPNLRMPVRRRGC